MINLDGGVVLPTPTRPKGFSRPSDIPQKRWDIGKLDRWQRAYTHCLYSLPLYFELPLHTLVPRMAKKMLEADDAFNVALRFMGEMELAGYVKFERGFDERVVVPTKKFLALSLDCERAPESAISFPKLTGEAIPNSPIRGGIANSQNRSIATITGAMASQEFEINKFTLGLITKYPPVFDKVSSAFMYHRALQSANEMLDCKFKFPYFLDSRGRIYTDTTCGFTPQGADHEKAILIPTYKEVLTQDGWLALLEAARGYSEQEWTVAEMAQHATYPDQYLETWMLADKPYSYMACADLIRRYLIDPTKPLPAFIPLDGRCSGLQHWSAVVRSNAITRHLGMHIEEAELDIYEKVAKDWRDTLAEEFKYLATRKAAKIPVMTWGYNATVLTSMEHMAKLFGAKSVWCDESKAYKSDGNGLDKAATGRAGADLYQRLQTTLGPLQHAVKWVSDAAAKVAKAGNVEVRWVTPDGFSCLQRKVKGKRLQLGCRLSNNSEFNLEVLDFTKETPNTEKHRSAIAPNIIHSLDATHLRMVAIRLAELGLPMVFIHDSFATHCNHRATLYKIIVEEFVKLYSRDYLAGLKQYWENLYGIELADCPEMGDWEPESLVGLDRFFL